MATRLRLTADTAPYTPATVRGSWTRTITTALAMSPTPTAASSTASTTVNTANTGADVVIRRFVSPAMLSPGTLAGTVSWVIAASETNAGLNALFHLHIYVTAGDSDTVRGTLLTDWVGTTEFGTSQVGMAVGPLALSAVGCQAGDRIVAVVGYNAFSSATTYAGRIGFGSDGADLTDGSTATTTSPGWFEFSGADPLFTAAASPPGQVFDLANWKLTLPTGTGNNPDEIAQPALATYTDANFYSDSSGRMVLNAPVQGVTTSGASGSTRCELREMQGGAEASWGLADGGVRQLTVSMICDPTGSTDRQEMIVAQIHSAGDTPPLYLAVEFNVASPRLRLYKDGPGVANLLTGLTASTQITARIRIDNGQVLVSAAVGDVSALPATPQQTFAATDFDNTDGARTGGCYVKGFAYNKSKISDGGTGAVRSTVSYLQLLQPGGTTPPAPSTIVEDFEDTTYAVAISGTWARTTSQAQTGAWSLRSAAIGDNTSTDAVVTVPAGATSVQFWFRVSSEGGYDYFRFLTGSTQQFQTSAEVPWTQSASYDVTNVSTITFRYVKDADTIAGSDAAWIDNLTFTVPAPPGLQAAATVAGAGIVTAGATTGRAAAAAVAGTGLVTATARQDMTVQATVAGAGAVTAGGARAQPGAAVVAGAGAMSATARLTQMARATVAGAGQMQALAGTQAAATVAGAGQVTATPRQGFAAQATVAGVGTVTAGARQGFGAAATVAGAGLITAGAARVQPVAAAVAGAGLVTAAGTRVHLVQATVAGAGLVSAAGTAVRVGAATVAGAGRVTATATVLSLLNASLWAVDRASGALTPLPHWVKLNISPIRNSAGAVSVEYPVRGRNFGLLRAGTLGDGTDVEVEVWLGGSRATAMRALLMQTEGEDLDGRATWTFSGRFLEQLLDEGIIGPQTPPAGSDKQDLVFTAASVGTIVATVLAQCQARGALTAITRDFTTALDSGGMAWPSQISLSFAPKTSLLAVLQRLAELGLCEFAVTAGRVLQVWRPEGRGVDRSVANEPPMFRHRRILDASRRHTVLDSYTAALGVGKDGVYAWASDATAQARRGRRIENGVDVGELADTGSVQAAAQRQLAADAPGQTELVYALAFGVGDPVPGRGFDVGDWVSCDTQQTRVRNRVVQWTLTLDREHGASGSATMNDLLADRRQRLQAQLEAITSGAVVVGSNPTGPDTTIPAAPTGLNASSIAYQDTADAVTYSSVTLGWAAVVTNTDGTAADDVAGYRVQYAYIGSSQVGPTPGPGSTLWREATPPGGVTGTQATFGGIGAGSLIALRVAAFDRSSHLSAWSSSLQITTQDDNVAPPVPAAPTAAVWFRTLDVTCNGLGAAGEAMPLDWDGNEVWISRSASIVVPSGVTDPVAFDPAGTGSQHVANLGPSAGTWNITDLTVGVGYYVALRSFDRAKNASALSTVVGPFTAEQLVQIDIGPDAIGRQQVIDLEVIRGKIANLSVNSAKVEEIQVGLITTGTLVATVTLSGQIRTALTGLRWEGDPSGIRFYNSAGVKTIDLQGASGNALITGLIQSGLSGTRWVMMPDGTLRLYGPGSGYAQLYNFGRGNDIVLRGRLDSNDRSGRINAGPVGVGMNFSSEDELDNGDLRSEVAVFDRDARITAPVVRLRNTLDYSAPAGDRRVVFVAVDNGAEVGGSALQYIYASSGGSGQNTRLANGAMNSAVVWRPGVILIRNSDDSAYIPINASNVSVSSGAVGKTQIRPLPGGTSLVERMKAAPARTYKRLAELTTRPHGQAEPWSARSATLRAGR